MIRWSGLQRAVAAAMTLAVLALDLSGCAGSPPPPSSASPDPYHYRQPFQAG